MWYLVMNGILDLKRYLVGTHYSVVGAQLIWISFLSVPFTFEIKASFEMLPAFIFLPIVMEIHLLNPRQ